MYLSRVRMDTSRRTTQIAMVSPNKIHGAVESAFAVKQKRNLWRIDPLRGEWYLLILSREKPDLSGIAAQFGYSGDRGEVKNYDVLLDRIREGSVWHFRLAANPTRSVRQDSGRGKVTAQVSVKYQMEWLNRKAGQNGFSVIEESADVVKSRWLIFRKKNSGSKVRIKEAVFEGLLQVKDVERFKNALVSGIGREKAYGMGLLTIAGELASPEVL